MACALALMLVPIGLPAHSLGLVPVSPAPTSSSRERPIDAAAKMSVRQSGAGKEPGLLKDIKGPAALLDFDFGDHRDFRSIAGAVDGPGGQKRGYLAGTGSFQPSRGSELRMSYIGDERGGAAVETRLARSFDDVRFTLASTFNHGFESKFTGTGRRTAERIFEGGAQMNAFSQYPVGAGLRETTRDDGSTDFDFLTLQMLPLGSGRHCLMNTTATPLTQADATTSGTLMHYSSVGALNLTAELDYLGTAKGMRPTEFRFTAVQNFENGWFGFASASEAFSESSGRFDIGTSRDFSSFVASASAGTTLDGSAYLGFRIIPALSASGQRWPLVWVCRREAADAAGCGIRGARCPALIRRKGDFLDFAL